MIARKWIVGAIVVLSASTLSAQAPAPAAAPSEPPPTRAQIINEMVDAGVQAAKTKKVLRPFQSTFGPGGDQEIAAYFIAAHSDRPGYKALLEALEARSSKQVGSTPSSKGTTSLAMKGLVPKILGVAVETGALNREISGTTITFRATPAGIVKALQGKGLFDMFADLMDAGV